MASRQSIQQKYDEERDKRLASSTIGRYNDVRQPGLEDLGYDLFADYEALARRNQPLKDGSEVRFLFGGAGHNAIFSAYHLIQRGIKPEEMCLVDMAGGFGGTWYWNRYPGLTCDVEGYIYLPLLEETGYMPKHKYSSGHEIRGQNERIAAQLGLRGMFCTQIESADWDEDAARWVIRLTQHLGPGKKPEKLTVRCQFFLPCGGWFIAPKAPAMPGFDEFKENVKVFHTARWDYNYTGGDEYNQKLVHLRDKRVGIIGTGATGVGCIPELAKWAKHLYVFQRTPSYCGPRPDVATTPESWAKVACKPGWQYERSENYNGFLTNDSPEVDLVNDGWTDTRGFSGASGKRVVVTEENFDRIFDEMMKVDVVRAEKVRAHIAKEVRDPETAEKLKPWYPGWCKRPTFHNNYLQTYNRHNVTLVHTPEGVTSYTDKAVIANGEEYEVDCLVLATGFSSTLNSFRSPMESLGISVTGRNGRSFTEKWSGNDFGTLFGIATHDFPNVFFCSVSGSTISTNSSSLFHMTGNLRAHVISKALEQAENPDKVIIEATKEAENKWTDVCEARSMFYKLNAAARLLRATKGKDPELRYAPFSGGILEYTEQLNKWIETSNLEGFKIE
ncbi:putative monooxygenase [Byssothecium circinans]|uniref:Putative monooxygenase n=1 Tax=Byssothecium circinans TaxID=147558 RepID=A0A6A5TA19_9PLEO|nr:putative monooxygenase [Byssothecium circinans]